MLITEGLLTVCSKVSIQLSKLKIAIRPGIVKKSQRAKNKLLENYWELLGKDELSEELFLEYAANLTGKSTEKFLNRNLAIFSKLY